MADYFIEFKPPARKELESLPDSVLARVVEKVEPYAMRLVLRAARK